MRLFTDDNDFRDTFRSEYPRLVNLAYRFVRRRDVAEDVVQEVFAGLWERNDKLHLTGDRLAYIRKAIASKCLTWLEREKRMELHASPDDKDGSVIAAEPWPGEEDKRIAAIRRAVDQLPGRCGMIFKLHRYEGLTIGEIASYLDLAPKTVENQLGRALKLLRERFS